MARKEIGVDELIARAVNEGLRAISERHPLFKYNPEFVARHVDEKKLREKINEIYDYVKERDGNVNSEYILEKIANYVASGQAFDKFGKEIIIKPLAFKRSLEEEAQSGSLWNIISGKRRKSRAELNGINYLENVAGAVQDLYSLFKTGDYAQRMPELAKAVTTVYDMGFLDPAVDILKSYGLMSDNKYALLKNNIKKKTKEGMENIGRGIEKYLLPQKIQKAAAAIIGISGLFVLGVSSLGMTGRITGNVVGNLSNFTGGIIGVGLIMIGIVLFWKGLKGR